VFAKELARHYGNQGIVSTSLYPGIVPPLFALRHLGSILNFIVVHLFMRCILIYIVISISDRSLQLKMSLTVHSTLGRNIAGG